jgi:hypothetical protein
MEAINESLRIKTGILNSNWVISGYPAVTEGLLASKRHVLIKRRLFLICLSNSIFKELYSTAVTGGFCDKAII